MTKCPKCDGDMVIQVIGIKIGKKFCEVPVNICTKCKFAVNPMCFEEDPV